MISFDLNNSKLSDALQLAEEFCSSSPIDKALCTRFKLVYEELVTNVFMHATKLNARKLAIQIEAFQDKVRFILSYDGEAFDPTKMGDDVELEKPLEERKVGGLGIFLVKQFASLFEYEYDNGFNRLTVEVEHS